MTAPLLRCPVPDCEGTVQATRETWEEVTEDGEIIDSEGAGMVRLYCNGADHQLGALDFDPASPARPADVLEVIRAAIK